ncbi:MAG: endonuclease III [candidate division NC10 bacterium]|nr:endonuclease III [candidate division NC10 bacterium]
MRGNQAGIGLSSQRLRRMEALLRQQWGPARKKPSLPPLDELILTILSQNTNDLNSGRAYCSLRQRFPHWDALRQAPLRDIEEAIRGGGLSRIKAKRIQAILGEIYRQRKETSLDFLRGESDEQVWAYLTRFRGVGPKTAACVMLFSLGRASFPVDTHIFRILSRMTGAVGNASPEKMQEELQEKVPPPLMYPLHLHLVRHGRQICRPQLPLCGECGLLPLCAYGKRLGRETSRRPARGI